MPDPQEISFEQAADTRAIASNVIRSQPDRFLTDSSSLGVVSPRTQPPPDASPVLSEWISQFKSASSAAFIFGSLPVSIVGASNTVLVIARASEAVFTTTTYDSQEIAKAKLKRLKVKHFSPEGRGERVARALEILSLPGPSYQVDKETWIWAAQDADIEDI